LVEVDGQYLQESISNPDSVLVATRLRFVEKPKIIEYMGKDIR
jgi:hypothetical protein